MHRITHSLLQLVVIASLVAPAVGAMKVREGTHPVVLSISPTSAHPGDTLGCSLTLDGTTQQDLSVTITPSDGSMFSALPVTVVVPAGQDHANFNATLSPYAFGGVALTASANGGYATSPLEAITP